jgi:hypothetical protein
LKRKCNDSCKCPYYDCSTDYWGEVDEWCKIGKPYRKMNSCYHSMLTRKILNMTWKLKVIYYEWCSDMAFLKEEKLRYKERVELGMTEEEFEQFEYDEMIKHEKLN